MLGIGFFEMIVIAGIALVVIGPERFPDVAKIAVRTLRELRGYMEEMKTEISKELKPVEKELRSLKEHNPEKYIDSLSKPVVAQSAPVEEKSDLEADEMGDEGHGAEAGDEESPNPEPNEGDWRREPYEGEGFKVAGGDEFDEIGSGPERLD